MQRWGGGGRLDLYCDWKVYTARPRRGCSAEIFWRFQLLVMFRGKVFKILPPTGVYWKGQCHEIFDFWFFSRISFPKASEFTIRAANFFENSRRYSQLMVHHRCRWHRWQMEKIFNQKNLNNFVGTPLDSRVNIYITFCLQGHLKVSAAWYIIPIICHRCRWHRWCTLTCEYLREFSEKFEMTLMLYSGASGKVIHEKTWSKKSRETVPLTHAVSLCLL